MLNESVLKAALKGLHSAQEIASLTPLQEVIWSPLTERGITLAVKREDLIHPGVSGNKLYKLLNHLAYARDCGVKRIVSFGGAYSNHLHALAISGQLLGIETIAVIRGEKPDQLSPTLQDCEAMGMGFKFVSRQDYKRRVDNDYIESLSKEFGHCHIVPEGGGGRLGALGCTAITDAIYKASKRPVNCICLACGTGTTMAGMVAGSSPETEMLGVAALKAAPGITQEVEEVASQITGTAQNNWKIESNFHGGGYAKVNDELIEIIEEFEAETAIPLDPVYTAKLFWAIKSKVEQGYWSEGSHIVAVHTGGLQGRRGFGTIWQ